MELAPVFAAAADNMSVPSGRNDLDERAARVFDYVFEQGHTEAGYDLVELIDEGWNPAPVARHLGSDGPLARTAAFVLAEASPTAVQSCRGALVRVQNHPDDGVRHYVAEALLRQPPLQAIDVFDAVAVRLRRGSGSLELVAASEASAVIEAADALGVRVLGIEGFDVGAGGVSPRADEILDLSDEVDLDRSIAAARAFIESLDSEPTHAVEFVFVL